MKTTLPGQAMFDIDAMLHEIEVHAAPTWSGAPLRFHTERRSPEELDAAFDRWIFEHGTFGCLVYSHMWNRRWGDHRKPSTAVVDGQVHTLQIYTADARCSGPSFDHPAGCSCIGSLLFRAFCLECEWQGEIRDDESLAVVDWHDHSMPGWRALPVVGSRPGSDRKKKRSPIEDPQPLDWQFPGAPIITDRGPTGHRAVEHRSPFGGYDIASVYLDEA